MTAMTGDPGGWIGEVLYEIRAIGGALRVAAIDPRTNVEVVICGPAGQGTEALKRIAARKLARRIARSDPSAPR